MSTSFQTTSRHILIAILEELYKSGHHITIIKKNNFGETEELPIELSGKEIEYLSVPFKPAKKNNFVARYFKDIEYVLKCNKYLNTKYDVVFVQSTNIAGVVFNLLQKKQPNAIKTLNVQDAFPDNAAFCGTIKGIIYQFFRIVQRYAYKRCDHIITISEDIKELLINYNIASEKIEVVFNWSYQDELFNKYSVNINDVSYIFDNDKYHVVYAGNIGLMQNVDLIIEAANIIRNDTKICFDIIGNGIYKDRLQKRVNELGLANVFFYPLLSSDLAPAIYCSSNINVIPLRKDIYRTALPSKTATCLACQQPIIFAIGKKSKFGKWISFQTGCPVVDSDNSQDLVDAIYTLMNDSTVCNTSEIYKKYFSKSINSRRYVEIMTTR